MSGKDETPKATPEEATPADAPCEEKAQPGPKAEGAGKPEEIGGPAGPEPTRFGDWEKAGRCTDF